MKDTWLGRAIAEYLKENRYTQTHMSKKTGIELPKWNLALNGNRRFTFEEYELICGALGVNTDKFLKPRTLDKGGSEQVLKSESARQENIDLGIKDGRRVTWVWTSKKDLQELNKKVADLEGQVQSQQKALIKHMDDHKQENAELKSIFEDLKKEIYKGTEQML